MKTADVIIIGGGIIGLATAYNLLQLYPGKRILILEKEDRIALHQSGHNSGVLHSGIYYKPGSTKAATCRAGKRAMEEFCAAEVNSGDSETAELVQLDPHAAGIKAIHVSETGIVDYKQVCARLAARFEERGSEIITGAKVVGLKETSTEAIVKSEAGNFSAPYVVNCA